MIGALLKWFFLILSGGILIVGLSPVLQHRLDQKGLIPNQYDHGDLYNITNLPAFREDNFAANADLTDADLPRQHYPAVHLYTIGDSFTDIDTSYYAGGRNVHVWVGRDHPTVAPLDTAKKNILVIELIERVMQERLYAPDYERLYIQNGIVQTPPQVLDSQKNVGKENATDWVFAHFGSEINQRLEFILFNSRFFSWFKERKAQLVLTLFGRVMGAVISSDRQHLFYSPEADSSYILCAFRQISDRKLDTLVTNLNTIRRHYLSMGFDEVYVCLIPNKVTVQEPTYGRYNHQIERTEANPRLETPFISTIDTLRQHPEWYHLGDGHWDKQGKRFWLRHINALAEEWATKPDRNP